MSLPPPMDLPFRFSLHPTYSIRQEVSKEEGERTVGVLDLVWVEVARKDGVDGALRSVGEGRRGTLDLDRRDHAVDGRETNGTMRARTMTALT
jgi:hypothetical protein